MLLRNYFPHISLLSRRLCHTQIVPKVSESPLEVIDTRDIPNDDFVDVKFKRKSVLEKCNEDISHIAPYLKPSFNFAAYVNKSNTLQQLVKLGVDLYKLEKRAEIPSYILGLDFERDIQQHVIFLCDLGVNVEEVGQYITKNPFIFQETLENLEVRVNYLKYKRFTNEMIARVISKNPYWLNFSTQRIDRKLGFFQNAFALTGNELRQLTVQQPRLITYKINHVKLNKFVFLEEMGFSPEETKSMLLRKPNLFMKAQQSLLQTFEFVHKTMNIPTERIAEEPEILTYRRFKIEHRYRFLEELKRVQFDRKKPNYISLASLISGTDAEFCDTVAKSSIQAFNMFLKSL